MKMFRKINDSNDGVAGILVAILLIGLFISILAFFQTVYVPQWMTQKEAEHMDEVANQFTQLKFSIDTLSSTGKQYNLISNPITLGSKELPFLSSNRAYGTIEIKQDAFKIILENSQTKQEISLGSLRYTSANAYFLDQSYIYENGAMILSQDSRDIIKVTPPFIVVSDNEIVFNLVKLTEIGGKSSASGYGTYPVQTQFSSSQRVPIDYVEKITIFSDYKDSWMSFFDRVLPDVNNDKLKFEITETTDGNGIIINFIKDDGLKTVYPRIYSILDEINIQISSGWAE